MTDAADDAAYAQFVKKIGSGIRHTIRKQLGWTKKKLDPEQKTELKKKVDQAFHVLWAQESRRMKDKAHAQVEWSAHTDQKRTSDELYKAIRNLGEPSCLDRGRGGGAIWYPKDLKGTPFYMVSIVDHMFMHSKPVPHADFLTYGIPFIANQEQIHEIEEYSKSIWYNRLEEVLYTRCHFEGANLATLALSILLLKGKIPKKKRDTKEKREELYKHFITSTMTGKKKSRHTGHYYGIIEKYVEHILPEWKANKAEHRG